MTKHLHLKKVLATLLTIAALAAGQQAFATITETFTFKGNVQTVNNTNYYNFAVGTSWGIIGQLPTQQGTYHQFNSKHFSWNSYTVTLNGTLRFQVSNELTDVVVQGSTFTVIFESQSLWFYGASVKKLNGTSVTNSNVTVSSDKHTVTVTINTDGTEFGQIILDYVSNPPFNSTNTAIGGIEDQYIYTGSPIEPVPTVTYTGTPLTAGTDYTVSYSNTTEPGTATVTVTGTGQYAGTVAHNYTIRAVALTDFTNLGNDTYAIASTTDLNHLATFVNFGNNCQGLTFKQTANIAYTHSDNWDNSSSTENNYTAIGTDDNPFQGTFDGQNHSISGIRIYKGGSSSSDKRQGIFGKVKNGTVKRVNLADALITGHDDVGGIVGFTFQATIEDCTVGADVCIHTVQSRTFNHGGIVGSNQAGPVRRCISRATLTVKNGLTGCLDYGGIVGYNSSNTITDCIAVGVVIPNVNGRGAIVGYKNSGTLTRNYYRDCKVASNSVTPSGVGMGTSESGTTTSDVDGAQPLFALTLGTNVTIERTAEATLPGTDNKTYANGADIAGVHYAYPTATVTLGYSGTVPAGQTPLYSVNGTAIWGNTFTMSTADCTVSVEIVDGWSGSGTQGDPYVITTTSHLDLLAEMVKNGVNFSGTYFVLGNDITYSHGSSSNENNFTPIGGNFGSGDKNFSGIFDGQGHIISGIRVTRNTLVNENVNKNLALFGRISGATIQNVILTDARITGYNYVGGLVGNKASGTVQNCLVLASTITSQTSYVGALFGGNSGTITANHYHGCTVNGTANATNVGVGSSSSSSDMNGARSIHPLTIQNANVTATGESVAYQGTTYYVSNTTVTLGYDNLPAGYTVTYSLNGTALTGNTFTMPANDDVVVSATVTAPTYTKAITAYHTENGVNYGWYLIASPIGTVNLTDVPHLFDNQYDLYYFDQTGGNNGKEWKNYKAHCNDAVNPFNALVSGKGYLYANSGNVTLIFNGTPYSGNGQVTLTYEEGHRLSGWNLIGNPFSTAATLDKPFYRMNTEGSALTAQVEAGNSVAAMEGVFVQASTNNETATFTQVNNSKGGEKKDVPMLNINLSHNQGAIIDNAIIRFDDGQALGKFTLHKDGSKLYIPQGGKDYAIANAEGKAGEMPINFKAEEDGTYTLTVNVEGLEMGYLHLIDNMTGVDIDLLHPNAVIAGEDPQSLVPLYTFQAKTTDYESRFKLVFASVCEDADDDNETFAYISNGNIIVNGEGTLQIFDALGRQVMRKQLSTVYAQLSTANFPAGVYMIRLINGENVRTQKVVVK